MAAFHLLEPEIKSEWIKVLALTIYHSSLSDTSHRPSILGVILYTGCMGIIDIDPWLEPHKSTIRTREVYIAKKTKEVLADQSLEGFSLGFQHFGLHKTDKSWIFREWAPNATKIVLVGDFSNWQEHDDFTLLSTEHGQWQIELPLKTLKHGQRYKLRVYWDGGDGWRIPSYASRVVQEEGSVDFAAEVWAPSRPYQPKYPSPSLTEPPLIYEAHVGMSSEEPKVSTYKEFTRDILPRIKKAGYNTIQLMAIQEHPYYGSFGYHVSNFFAVSSRSGTPDDFARLVDTAHKLGLKVIIDIVHSHAVKNEAEGLSRFDGTLTQYFKGDHPAWDSRIFDYGKPEVLHFLLSNCRYWLDQYNVDGFRFDGVTSMLYTHHGLEKTFTGYDDYYRDDVDKDALVYLRLANQLIHKIKPDALTVAEEMSGLPGVAGPIEKDGLGFDYRLAMGTPDLWIKTLKEQADEDWDLGHLFHTLSSHRPEEKVISYAESHDQALVGDQTLIFRLIDKEMYWHMQKSDTNLIVERGVALHKMIRLLTASTSGGGYLNFMGNEFGHPEWIDFPREGNDWSYQHARRQWSLVDNELLKYSQLNAFDREMLKIIKHLTLARQHYIEINEYSRCISFMRDDYLFAFNFSPNISLTGHQLLAPSGSYSIALTTDETEFGGHGRIDTTTRFFTAPQEEQHFFKAYLPARTAVVFQKID